MFIQQLGLRFYVTGILNAYTQNTMVMLSLPANHVNNSTLPIEMYIVLSQICLIFVTMQSIILHKKKNLERITKICAEDGESILNFDDDFVFFFFFVG